MNAFSNVGKADGPLPNGTEAAIPTLLLTYEEVAQHLRWSVREVRRMVSEGLLPVVGRGKLKRIAYEDVRAWVKCSRRFEAKAITPDTLRLIPRVQRTAERSSAIPLSDAERLEREFPWD